MRLSVNSGNGANQHVQPGHGRLDKAKQEIDGEDCVQQLVAVELQIGERDVPVVWSKEAKVKKCPWLFG
jgi:hypothetical protein